MLVNGAKGPNNILEKIMGLASGGTFTSIRDSKSEAKRATQQLYNKTMKLAVEMNHKRKQMEADQIDESGSNE